MTKQIYNNNMYFFRCLPFFLYGQITEAEKLTKVVFPDQTQATFPGLNLRRDLKAVEAKFYIRIRVSGTKKTKKTVAASRKRGTPCILKCVQVTY